MKKILGVIAILFLVCGCATSHLENGEESVVKFKDNEGISAEDLYEKLKEQDGFNTLMNLVDDLLLSHEYKESANENENIKQAVDYYKDLWGDSFSTYITSYFGVKNESGLKDYLRLQYRKNLWYLDYAKTQVNDTQIEDYYNNVAIGDISASHILIKSDATDSMSADEKAQKEKEAYDKAVEVINRLNNGEDFATLAKELSDDDGTKNSGGSLGSFNYDDNFDDNFMEAVVAQQVGTYSKEPVKSQYGYHIIYKTAQADKPSLDDIREDIISTIAEETVENDTTFRSKALKALREKYEMDITDSDLDSEYKETYEE